MIKEVFKAIGWVLLGAALFVGVTSLTVLIASSVNHLTFAQQITDWFGENLPVIEETAKESVKTLSAVFVG